MTRRGWIRRRSVFWRVFLVDAVVLGVATILLTVTPITISAPIKLDQLAVLVAGLATMLLLSLGLLYRTLRPLKTLTETMRRIDPMSPGERVVVEAAGADVATLSAAFNDMLDRLETERRESARAALSVQESERRRIARELHDEVGQTLTAMLLQIEGLATEVPDDVRDEVEELRETARTGAEDVRRIAQRLRPEALDELGLHSALLALTAGFADHAKVATERQIARDLPLNKEEELVVYRVAQEALTNIARHARARHAELLLGEEDGSVVLRVDDDGAGAKPSELMSSYGIRGMRERAMLIGGTLSVESDPGQGTHVVLRIPTTD
jgi:two-component system, NarL family, sensor histidine kinase UhpB